ncbi:hypothetical protein PAP_06145 [Palaeococcus pacificus DY20341]|uniref:Uncharacterized protein n=1 Tax=Palaeococcus pacificus DY20341 TaxID=1343739 RepID=A0A075LTI1_9EURY|nr:hypothetical protein [Palaeococcus pacificus]AIF69629.1 hypothetical protein PAP_06145 [Palaeococcus pacificus DY20341]
MWLEVWEFVGEGKLISRFVRLDKVVSYKVVTNFKRNIGDIQVRIDGLDGIYHIFIPDINVMIEEGEEMLNFLVYHALKLELPYKSHITWVDLAWGFYWRLLKELSKYYKRGQYFVTFEQIDRIFEKYGVNSNFEEIKNSLDVVFDYNGAISKLGGIELKNSDDWNWELTYIEAKDMEVEAEKIMRTLGIW